MSTVRRFVALALEALLGVIMAIVAYDQFTMSPPSFAQPMEALHYPGWYWQLATVLAIIGVIGLLVGLFNRTVGAAAALWMICYFIAATFTHLLRGDLKDLGLPLSFLAFSAIIVALRWSDVTALLKARQSLAKR